MGKTYQNLQLHKKPLRPVTVYKISYDYKKNDKHSHKLKTQTNFERTQYFNHQEPYLCQIAQSHTTRQNQYNVQIKNEY